MCIKKKFFLEGQEKRKQLPAWVKKNFVSKFLLHTLCTSTVRKFTKSTVMTRLKRLNRGDIPKYVTIVTQLMYLEIGKIVQYRIHTTLKECLLEYLKS